jgi:hypothetical protein
MNVAITENTVVKESIIGNFDDVYTVKKYPNKKAHRVPREIINKCLPTLKLVIVRLLLDLLQFK